MRWMLHCLLCLSLLGTACSDEEEKEAPPTPERQEPEGKGEGHGVSDAWREGDLAAQLDPHEGEPRDGGEVAIQIDAEPASLDLLAAPDWFANQILAHRVYESLVGYDPYDAPRYRFVPELAERWELSDDGKKMTFHLRHDVKWHDGESFDADDVVATFDHLRRHDEATEHYRPYVEAIEDVRAKDPHTVEITWREPYFLALDAMAMVPVFPKHLLESDHDFAKKPVGTGPFRFESREPHVELVLAKNDEYWGEKPHLGRVRYRVVGHVENALSMAEDGELDVVTRIGPEHWEAMHSPELREHFLRSKLYGNNYAFIGWNEENEALRDVRVRRALGILFDRDELVRTSFLDLYEPTDCAFYFASRACDYEHEPLPQDPERAERLLERAGWEDTDGDGVRDRDGKSLELSILFPQSSEDAEKVAWQLHEKLAPAGVKVHLEPARWSEVSERLATGEFDAVTLMWRTPGPVIDPAQMWHTAGEHAGANYVGYRSERVDRLIDELSKATDDEARIEKEREIMGVLWEDQPYTFLYVRPRLSIVRDTIHGVRETLFGWQPEEWWLER